MRVPFSGAHPFLVFSSQPTCRQVPHPAFATVDGLLTGNSDGGKQLAGKFDGGEVNGLLTGNSDGGEVSS